MAHAHDMIEAQARQEIPALCRKTGEIQMDTTAPTARAQFVQDYTLITDNDRMAYRSMQMLLNQKGAHNVPWLSDKLRENFENQISEVVERERRRGNETTADLIAQMLIGYGSDPFDDIARYYIDTDLENRLVARLSSVLKAGI